jgi:hypothetical protein
MNIERGWKVKRKMRKENNEETKRNKRKMNIARRVEKSIYKC